MAILASEVKDNISQSLKIHLYSATYHKRIRVVRNLQNKTSYMNKYYNQLAVYNVTINCWQQGEHLASNSTTNKISQQFYF